MRSWFASNHREFARRFVGGREQENLLARRTARSGACLVALAIGVMVSWGYASQNVGDPQSQIATGRSEMAQGDSQSNHDVPREAIAAQARLLELKL